MATRSAMHVRQTSIRAPRLAPVTTRAEDLLTAPPLTLLPAPPSPERTRVARDRWLGRVVGHYRLDSVLGAGGMGTVYLAEHLRLGRRAALKLPHASGSLGERIAAKARLLAEARLLCRAASPHVVGILDCGEARDGRAYLVMEHLDGPTLAEVLTRGPLPLDRVADIGCALADALAAVHAAGIVHCDLKPENVLFSHRGDATARVKLLDFGIARDLRGPDLLGAPDAPPVGTPAYMAPEQCAGARDAIDPRTDLYALGVILYRMVTGTVPFVGRAASDVLAAQRHLRPVSPRCHSLEVGGALEAVILRALEKSPARRFRTAEGFARALRDAFDEQRGTDCPSLVGVPRPRARPRLDQAESESRTTSSNVAARAPSQSIAASPG